MLFYFNVTNRKTEFTSTSWNVYHTSETIKFESTANQHRIKIMM